MIRVRTRKHIPLQIGLIGPYGFGNLGDDATQQVVIEEIRRYLPHADIVGISLNPHDTETRYGIKAIPISRLPHEGWNVDRQEGRSGFARILQKLWRVIGRVLLEPRIALRAWRSVRGFAMLIVSGGGQLDDSFGGALSHPYTLWKWGLIAKVVKARLVFLSVGAGPIDTKLGNWFFKKTLHMADYRSYRDADSKKFMYRRGFRLDDPVYPDLAHRLHLDYCPVRRDSASGLTLGLGPMAYGTRSWPFQLPEVYRNYMENLSTFIVDILNEGFVVRLFPGEAGVDRDAIDDLKAAVGRKGGSELAARIIDQTVTTVKELMEQIQLSDVAMSSRFHGIVLAHLAHKPSISISHHPKMNALMEDMGHARFCLDIHDFSVDELKSKFEHLVSHKEELAAEIKTREEEYGKLLDEQFQSVVSLLRDTPHHLLDRQ
jgi:polysaccharide pyruvyl transferase WcaK-like protein